MVPDVPFCPRVFRFDTPCPVGSSDWVSGSGDSKDEETTTEVHYNGVGLVSIDGVSGRSLRPIRPSFGV